MKRFIFATIVVLCSLTGNAQLCSNAQTTVEKPPFTPALFTPVPIGSTGTGVAYLKSAPAMTLPPIMIVAYVYMVGADGKVAEVGISGELFHVPSDWNGTFYGDEKNPVKYPLAIPVIMKMNGLKTADGKLIGQPEIFF